MKGFIVQWRDVRDRPNTMTEANCANCGIVVSDTPEKKDMHPVQMLYDSEAGDVYCEACFFGGSDAEASEGEYEHTGDVIVRAAEVDEDDEELAELLADTLQAQELRTWMSAHDLKRSRGARKKQSAEEAVEQDRTFVAAFLDKRHDLADDAGDYSVVCNHCDSGLEEWYGSAEAAEEAAEEHKAENPSHFPNAWGPDGERIYG